MNLRTDYVIGKKTDKVWSGVYGYKPYEEVEFKQLGEMFAVVRVSTTIDDFAIDKFAKIMIESLQTAYFEELKDYKSTLERLEESSWKMKAKIDMLLSREEEISLTGIDIEIATVVFKDDYLYALTIGESSIAIVRDGNYVDITNGLTDSSRKGFFKSASLELTPKDRVVLMTSQASSKLMNIEEAAQSLDKEKLIEKGSQEGVSMMIIADSSLNWKDSKVEDVVVTSVTKPKEDEEISIEKGEDLDEVQEEADVTVDDDVEDSLQDNEIDPVLDDKELDSKENLEDTLGSESESVEIDEDDEVSAEVGEDIEVGVEANPSFIASTIGQGKGLLSNLKNKVSSFGSSKQSLAPREIPQDTEGTKSFTDRMTEELEEDAEDVVVVDAETTSKSGTMQGVIAVPVDVAKSGARKVRNHFRDNHKTYAHIINSIIAKIRYFISRLYDLFEREVLGKNLDRRMMNRKRIRRNRYLLIIGIVVLSLFLYSSFRSRQQNIRESRAVESIEADIDSYTSEYGSIESQVQNLQFSGGQDKFSVLSSIDLLITSVRELRDEVETNDAIKQKDSYIADLNNIERNLTAQRDELLLVESFTEAPIIADLSRQFSDAELSDLVHSEGFLFISDQGRDVIYRVATELNSEVEVHVTEVTSPEVLVKNVAGEVIVYDRNDDSVIGKFNPNDKESLVRFENLIPPSVGNAPEAAIFSGNDSLYEVRPIHQQIFKRDKTGEGYVNGGATFQSQNPPNWKQDPELARAIDIDVPYEIYVLVQDLGVRRYLAGGPNTLERNTYINLLDEDFNALQSATSISVTTKYMAVADSQNQRILLFEIQDNEQKNVRFIKQYQYKGDDSTILSDITEVQVVEGESRVYVLDGNRVMRFAI
jgi:hypothetical protein